MEYRQTTPSRLSLLDVGQTESRPMHPRRDLVCAVIWASPRLDSYHCYLTGRMLANAVKNCCRSVRVAIMIEQHEKAKERRQCGRIADSPTILRLPLTTSVFLDTRSTLRPAEDEEVGVSSCPLAWSECKKNRGRPQQSQSRLSQKLWIEFHPITHVWWQEALG